MDDREPLTDLHELFAQEGPIEVVVDEERLRELRLSGERFGRYYYPDYYPATDE